MLQSPLLTAEWEQRLKQIERGEADPEAFLQDIQEMIVHLLKTAKPVKGAPALFPSERVSVGACPLCGMAVTETPKGILFAAVMPAGSEFGRTIHSLPPEELNLMRG